MSIGLAIIARDEEENLPTLLASIEGDFDQVVLADTGSTDRTVEVFEAWAEAQDLPLGWRVEPFEWRDDFAAAREFADSLLTTEWICYANADEEAVGTANLRDLIGSLPPEVVGIANAWDYVGGGLIYTARVTRRDHAKWSGRIHELRDVDGPVAAVPPQLVLWRHRRRSEADWQAAERRNDAILAKWLEDEPDNERALYLEAGLSPAEGAA